MLILGVLLSVLVITVLTGYVASRQRKKGLGGSQEVEISVTPSEEQEAPSQARTVTPEAPVPQEPVAASQEGDGRELEHTDHALEEEAPEYRERLGRSRGLFASLRARVSARGGIDEETLEELEASLLSADVGVATTTHILETVRARAAAKDLDDAEGLLGAVRSELLTILTTSPTGETVDRTLHHDAAPEHVAVWLFVGVNGVGKTTTIGKLATKECSEGRKVLLAAGDTFRAAAADQLAMWAERSGAEIVRGAEGGDPSAVVFDAIQRGGARKVDLVLADTAGRLHTKINLIEELKKVRRVAERDPGDVCEVLLVLDATTGQNAVSQAKQFSEAVAATGVVLTKLDGTARGGVVVAIQREIGLPVKLVGLGEGAHDLVAFDPEAFVDALLAP